MISKDSPKPKQYQVVSLDSLVPEDHLLRKIDENIDFSFIYDLVEDKYSPDFGRPSLDPVTLIKIPIIQYMFGIKSMRQTIKDIEVNVAYRWFLGLELKTSQKIRVFFMILFRISLLSVKTTREDLKEQIFLSRSSWRYFINAWIKDS